jgi:precorrin-2 dehydrogenase/sirohydrochlorin ferrochelatase
VIVPTSFNIGDIEISIFTNGKSPLMARQLRKKIQSIITEDDILEIELQDYARSQLKGVVDNQKERKKCLYQIFEDEKINDLIKSRKMDDAKDYIDKLIRGLE